MNQYAKDIIRQLDKVTASGNRQSVIFEDWLDLVHSSLSALPAHLRSAIQNRTFAADTEETNQLHKRLRERYPKDYCWDAFAKAFAILLDSTNGGDSVIAWDDTIGQVYMDWGMPNKYSGQFFTPYELAKLMAQISMEDIDEQIYRHLEEAYLQTPSGTLHQLMWPERVTPFVRRMGPDLLSLCAEHYKPVTVSDCCCGSGVMLLAAAEMTPRWARDWGMVMFSGQDIDMTCVRMAQVNMMLYGLNGFNLKCAFELSQAELLAIPEPYRSAYQEAQENPEQAEDITLQLRAWKQEILF